jgi:hypothetical protein
MHIFESAFALDFKKLWQNFDAFARLGADVDSRAQELSRGARAPSSGAQ